MDNEFDLAKVITQYPDALSSRSKLAAVLHDLYPEERYKTNLALAVYDCGISNRIHSSLSLDSRNVGTFMRQLESDWGMKPENALQGVELWAAAYHISMPPSSLQECNTDIPKTISPQGDTTKVTDNNNKTRQDSYTEIFTIDEYELEKKIYIQKNGKKEERVYISEFLGFDEPEMIVPSLIKNINIYGISKGAYKNCERLMSVKISEGIKSISEPFEGCRNLTKIEIPSTSCTFQLSRCDHLRSVVLTNGIKEIPDAAFGNADLDNVILPTTIERIGKVAFHSCFSLNNIVLNARLKTIDAGAFYFCNLLKKIVIPSTVEEIGSHAFGYCSNLRHIELNEGLKSIGDYAFEGCDELKQVIIPKSVIYIGENAFPTCKIDENGEEMLDEDGHRVRSDLILYCYAGSKAVYYARENGYTVKNAAELTAQGGTK